MMSSVWGWAMKRKSQGMKGTGTYVSVQQKGLKPVA